MGLSGPIIFHQGSPFDLRVPNFGRPNCTADPILLGLEMEENTPPALLPALLSEGAGDLAQHELRRHARHVWLHAMGSTKAPSPLMRRRGRREEVDQGNNMQEVTLGIGICRLQEGQYVQDDFCTKHNVAQVFCDFDRCGRSIVHVRLPICGMKSRTVQFGYSFGPLMKARPRCISSSSQSAANLQMNLRGRTSLAPNLADKQAFNEHVPKLCQFLRHFPTCTFTSPCHFLLQSCSTCSDTKQELDVNLF